MPELLVNSPLRRVILLFYRSGYLWEKRETGFGLDIGNFSANRPGNILSVGFMFHPESDRDQLVCRTIFDCFACRTTFTVAIIPYSSLTGVIQCCRLRRTSSHLNRNTHRLLHIKYRSIYCCELCFQDWPTYPD